ncbi:MAG: glycoside hydrolase family 2 TIM barrel-domain containing protein [Anaerolineae bacterium]
MSFPRCFPPTLRGFGLAMLLVVLLSMSGCGPGPTPALTPTTAPTPAPPSIPRSFPAVPPSSLPLSGEWRFAADPDAIGEDEGWAEPAFDDSAWTAVTVPHTWNVMMDYYEHDGLAWYRKRFTLPATAQDAHLRLHFEAVFYLARVWLNDEYLGQHEGGYTPFEFDVSGIAEPGAENVIAVQVDNVRATDRIPATLRPPWSFDWWNYGGIVRDISLHVSSRAFIARQQIVAVPHLVAENEADTATVTATVTITNASTKPLEGTLTADVLDDATGQSVLASRPTAPVSLPPGQSADVQLMATIASPKLWHFDHPNLYRWSASLLSADGQTLHSDEETCGVRLVELTEARFYLNGEPGRLVGLTRHADSPEHGLAETVTVMAADYDDLKRLNMVFSRPVHYPQSEFILDYCDRNGILLIPEVPAWQLNAAQMADPDMLELAQQQLREMIAADFNHPSVWAWSVGNEFDSTSTAGHEYVREMINLAKSLDPTRPVGFASNRLNRRPQDDATDLADFVMMNQYFGTWVGPKGGLGRALDWIHQTWPDKVVIISEYGFEPHWNTLWGPSSDSLDLERYYFIPEDMPSDSEEADAQRRQVIVEQMEVFRSKPFVAGAIFWTYQDYRTPSGFMMGVVDAERNRRGSWGVLREEYTPVLIDSVAFSSASGDSRSATVTLRTRGAVEEDMPAYTLRGYSLHWAVASPEGDEAFSEGDLPLPTLPPGTAWSGEVEWAEPGAEYVLTLSVVRPTGFTVSERSYDLQGKLLPTE